MNVLLYNLYCKIFFLKMVKSTFYKKLAFGHFKNGQSVQQILLHLNNEVSQSTLYTWKNLFDNNEPAIFCRYNGRPRSINILKNRKKVKRLLKSKNTGRQCVRMLNISQTTIRRIINESNLYSICDFNTYQIAI